MSDDWQPPGPAPGTAPQPPDIKKGSAVFQHCVTVYDLMDTEATPATIEGKPVRLYEGFVTALFREELALTTSYYSQVMNELKRMGCVALIRRGGGQSPSRWALMKRPTYDAYIELGGKEYVQGGPKSSQNLAAVTEMYRDLSAKYDAMLENYGNLSNAMVKALTQLDDLQTQVNHLLTGDKYA